MSFASDKKRFDMAVRPPMRTVTLQWNGKEYQPTYGERHTLDPDHYELGAAMRKPSRCSTCKRVDVDCVVLAGADRDDHTYGLENAICVDVCLKYLLTGDKP